MSNWLSVAENMSVISRIEIPGPSAAEIRATRARAEMVIQFGRNVAETLRSLGRAFTWIDRRVDEAKAMNELALMNERMLADVGLTRSDIPLVGSSGVRGAAA